MESEIDIDDELERLREESPETYALLKALAGGKKDLTEEERELNEQREEDKKHPPFLKISVTFCPLCYSHKEEFTFMQYRKRISSFIRVRSARKEEIESDMKREYLLLSTITKKSCGSCRSVLEMLPKNEIIERLLNDLDKWEVVEMKLKNRYKKEKGLE